MNEETRTPQHALDIPAMRREDLEDTLYLLSGLSAVVTTLLDHVYADRTAGSVLKTMPADQAHALMDEMRRLGVV